MRDDDFERWLERHYKTAAGRVMARNARQSRISNCRNVEAHEGDLDRHYANDEMASLLKRFEYSREEEARHVKPRHKVPIDGCQYDGTATLKSAIRLYTRFCRAWPQGRSAPLR